MGAGGSRGVLTNSDKVVEIIKKNPNGEADLDYTGQLICDALGVYPEGEWKAPECT